MEEAWCKQVKQFNVASVDGDEVVKAANTAEIAFNCEKNSWAPGWVKLREREGPGVIWAGYEGETVSCSCVAFPQRIWFGQKEIQGGAVGGVGTLPERRKQGFAEAMLREALRFRREAGDLITFLWPFSYRYYRKLGWEHCGDVMRYSLSREKIAELEGGLECHPLEARDLPSIHSLWSAFARQFNCCGVRPPYIWDDWFGSVVKLQDGKEVPKMVGAFGDNGLEGFTSWGMTEELPQLPHLTEIVYSSRQALESLLKFVSETVPFAGEIGWDSAMTQAGQLLYEESRDVPRKVATGHMARVHHPGAFLESVLWASNVEGRLCIRMTDPVFGESKTRVEVSKGECRVAPGSGGLELETTIQVFTQIATGYLSPCEAVRMGLVAASQLEAARLLSGASCGLVPFRSFKEPG